MRLLPLQSTRTDTFFPYQTLFLSKQGTLVPVRILPQDFPLLDPVPTATKPANALALHDQAHMSCQRPRAALAQPPARCDRDEVRPGDRKSTRMNSSHSCASRMPSSSCKKQHTTKHSNHKEVL